MKAIPWLTAAVLGLIAGCAGIASAPSQEERQALAPTGKLRVALYLGAPVSIIRGATPDESKGVGFDLGRELARRIGVPFEPVVYPSPGAIIRNALYPPMNTDPCQRHFVLPARADIGNVKVRFRSGSFASQRAS